MSLAMFAEIQTLKARLTALEAEVAELKAASPTNDFPTKRGPGRPPKDNNKVAAI